MCLINKNEIHIRACPFSIIFFFTSFSILPYNFTTDKIDLQVNCSDDRSLFMVFMLWIMERGQ